MSLEEKEKADAFFSVEHKIFIIKPLDDGSPSSTELKQVKFMNHQVGGFMGKGTTTCFSKFSMERNEYYGGEKVRVRININNMECKKDIKEIKIKLLRAITAVGDGRMAQNKEIYIPKYIGDWRFGSLKAGDTFDNDVVLHFPEKDLDHYQSVKIVLDKRE